MRAGGGSPRERGGPRGRWVELPTVLSLQVLDLFPLPPQAKLEAGGVAPYGPGRAALGDEPKAVWSSPMATVPAIWPASGAFWAPRRFRRRFDTTEERWKPIRL